MQEKDPVSILLKVVKQYLMRKSTIIFSLARTSGQKQVKIELLGLMREYTRIYLAGKLSHILREIINNKNYLEKLKEYGITEIVLGENSKGYIVIDIELAEKKLLK